MLIKLDDAIVKDIAKQSCKQWEQGGYIGTRYQIAAYLGILKGMEMQAALGATVSDGWEDIAKLPNSSEVVLFFRHGRKIAFMARADDYYNGAFWTEQARHWRPLPAPPSEEG